ncbi:MAG: response regulator [Bordetella sp.]|jgi:two-component system response regulator DctR
MKTLVHLIDDDLQLAEALTLLLRAEGHTVTHFESGESYLAHVEGIDSQDRTPVCILLDLHLGGGLNGLATFEKLLNNIRHELPPVIFLTGNGDLQTGVSAIKMGAYDFLAKPAKTEELLEKIKSAQQAYSKGLERAMSVTHFREALDTLTRRQREVLELLLLGHTNKEVSEKLSTSVRTVEIHRAALSERLGGLALVEIGQLIERLRSKEQWP